MKYLRKFEIKLVKGEYKNLVKGQVRSPRQIYQTFKKLKDNSQETLIGVYMTHDLEMNFYDVLSVGGENAAFAIPREIIGRVLMARSTAFILIHNHPSGNPNPSEDDKRTIRNLVEGSKPFGLLFVDFIIVGDLGKPQKKNYWSMFEQMAGDKYDSRGLM